MASVEFAVEQKAAEQGMAMKQGPPNPWKRVNQALTPRGRGNSKRCLVQQFLIAPEPVAI
jgi:hypothetical protein